MKRLFLIISASAPTLLLVALFVYNPPRDAASQPFHPILQAPPQDTPRKPDSGLEDFRQSIDSVNKNAALLKSVAKEGERLADKIEKDSKSLKQEVKKQQAEDPAPVYIEHTPDTVEKMHIVKVPVVDSAMAGKTWYGQLRVHMSRCRIKYLFKPKQWGKGKF